ncbi:hypothetical protein IFO70_14865 [Phormidium tenue FACHB-886]|nr:hypothetical protein [Phormidium tenue FACHB-886]
MSWREGRYLLQGMTLALAFLAAVGTVGGVLFIVFVALAPGSIGVSLRDNIGSLSYLQGQLMLAAALQTIGWGFLPHIQFVQPHLARWMTIVMGTATLFLLALVLFSL